MLGDMQILPVPCLKDNYAYLVVDEPTRRAAVVDPSEADPVRDQVTQRGLTLEAIWLTHHHWDHVGGVEGLCEQPGVSDVVGSAHDQQRGRIPRQTRGLADGDTFEFAGQTVRVIEIPGHTLGAIAYVVEGNLFSGDTLFLGGCGRVFEGTMDQMTQSLDKLRQLPRDTQVWCGHEYTVKNLDFARTVEPGNDTLAERHAQMARLRDEGHPTVPGRLEDELMTNPFLRFDAPALAQGRGAVETFTAIRKAKDRF
jgi:hydroxyacylglutathione hydrolase